MTKEDQGESDLFAFELASFPREEIWKLEVLRGNGSQMAARYARGEKLRHLASWSRVGSLEWLLDIETGQQVKGEAPHRHTDSDMLRDGWTSVHGETVGVRHLGATYLRKSSAEVLFHKDLDFKQGIL